jgi:AraC-like DNA-binding protein
LELNLPDVILDRLLTTMDVAVEAFAICEVRRGFRLIGGASAVEVHYVLSGTLVLTVADRPTVRCGPGSIIIVPPGLRQIMAAEEGAGVDVHAADSCAPTRSGMLLFDAAEGGPGDVRLVCGLIAANISGSFGLLDAVKQPLVEDLSDMVMVRHSYAAMLDEISGDGLGARALTGALMKACLIVLLRRHFARDAGSSVLSSLRDPRLGKAVTTVLDRPAAAHSVASLARTAGMSRSAFAREFSTHLAMSPMVFVARTRLHHAAELLTATRLPVKVIAASVGFASRSHFSRAFSAAYGADPSGFRKVSGHMNEGAGARTGAPLQ